MLRLMYYFIITSAFLEYIYITTACLALSMHCFLCRGFISIYLYIFAIIIIVVVVVVVTIISGSMNFSILSTNNHEHEGDKNYDGKQFHHGRVCTSPCFKENGLTATLGNVCVTYMF